MARRIVIIAVAALTAAGLTAVVVLVAGAESPPTAREALDRMKRFANAAESVEYHAKNRLEVFDVPDATEPVEAVTVDEAAAFPDRSRSVLSFGELVSETLTVEGVSYSRLAQVGDELDDEQWISSELLARDAPVSSASTAVPGGVLVAPEALPALLDTARRPRIVGRGDGSTTIRVKLDLEEVETLSLFLDPTVELVVEDDDGRPLAMRLVEEDEFASQAMAVQFVRWNGSLEIEEPERSALDPTPAFDEEGIAAYDVAPLYQPRSIPEDWVLESATVLPAGATPEGCEQVTLALLDQDSDEFGYLDLYLLPESCAQERPEQVEGFVAGEYSGWFEDDEGYVYGEIVVGDTIIQFDTDLSEEDLAAVLADLVPLDLANPPTPTVAFS